MKVTRLELWNFRGIKHLTVDFTQRTTVFVGVNGVGKSTVLDALAIALSQLTCRLHERSQAPRMIDLDDIRLGAESAQIAITVAINSESVRWVVARSIKDPKEQPGSQRDLTQLEAFCAPLLAAYEDEKLDGLPLAVYYDVHRAVLDVPLRVREKLEHSASEVYQDALDHGGADFKRFFIWFRDFEDIENELRLDEPDFRYQGLEATRQAVQTFAGFENLRIRRKPTMRMTVTKAEKELNVLQLSDGERNMLALVGDIARRLSVLNFYSLNKLNEGAGVVLIDEIDLHLHPRWQREVVAKLEATFPHCQFIVSTHSPQVVGELRPESVMILRDGVLTQAPRSLGLSSSEVLEELMEGTSRNHIFQKKIREVERALEDEQYAQAREMLETLRANFGELPEVLRLGESLEWFDPVNSIQKFPADPGERT
ncbi:AAA family ATPase [Giesbergeria anulus]|uniref:Predicted ATP-binding protein involved in virulence n=1 Tax=Giesbergeria anulus TaxID=180197 RepID=A0A1H9NPF7_9BURK|nr:AAA family ATPase [Giesbergeria anulus]SER37771.1 Predicted ATP-binding protein involved in virulence [Giesbergeria anulus]